MSESKEEMTVREAVFFMKNINHCIEEIVRVVDNNVFRNNLFMAVSYPLRNILKDWDEWYDMEKGIKILSKEKKTF